VTALEVQSPKLPDTVKEVSPIMSDDSSPQVSLWPVVSHSTVVVTYTAGMKVDPYAYDTIWRSAFDYRSWLQSSESSQPQSQSL